MNQLLAKCEELENVEGWMGKRDAAILAVPVMFGRRRGELRALKKEDIEPKGSSVFVTFSVLKSHIPPKVVCPKGHSCKKSWYLCPECGSVLLNPDKSRPDGVEIGEPDDKPVLATNQRPLAHPFAKYLVTWRDEVEKGGYICAKSPVPGIFETKETQPLWGTPLSGPGITNVVKKHTEGLWPHLLRHNLATSFAGEGFDAYDLLTWFNWRRYDTAFKYVQLGAGGRIKKMAESKT